MQHFYDGQIRRYITQMIRLLSNFSYKDGDGNLVQVPVTYGDLTRQVASIIRDNSENKIPSAPRIAVYVTGLEQDRDRTTDSSFVSKVHLREREFDDEDNEYLNTQGKNYTVERLMPSPYTLTLNADIWSTNTDQKLQIMEQILMLFNPSLEIQTTDNYVDWTSLSVVNLESTTFSNRSIPIGVESEIDIATLGFSTPIYISPPVKVKKMGVITSIIMSIFDEKTGDINLGESMPELLAYDDAPSNDYLNRNNENIDGTNADSRGVRQSAQAGAVTYQNYDLVVLNNVAQLISKGRTGVDRWEDLFAALPGSYKAGITQIQLRREGLGSSVNGTVAINPLDETKLNVTWDEDTIPTNTILNSDRGTVDKVIDPLKYNPANDLRAGLRLLLLGPIGDEDNADGPDAWKGPSNVDFHAGENDIIEWDGDNWNIIFDASAKDNLTSSDNFEITYITNLNTGVQYKWTGTDWVLSYEGEYRKGTWRIVM